MSRRCADLPLADQLASLQYTTDHVILHLSGLSIARVLAFLVGIGMIILDGGLGRELQAMGAPFRQPEWSALALMEGPEFVRAAHDAFVHAGADIVTTNSYAIVPFHIGADVFVAHARELLRLSGKLARAAADDAGRQVRVAASVPPMFGSYQPDKFDPHAAADMMRLFRDELAGYADLFLAETQGSVAEAELFLTEFMPAGRPVWLSVTLDDVGVTFGQPRLRQVNRLAMCWRCVRPKHRKPCCLIVLNRGNGRCHCGGACIFFGRSTAVDWRLRQCLSACR